ncbi:MAG: prepilin peptidase [Eubacteriaceae bacterium]|nr:prepilin peptidase [Eubacteriaceae bacterium]
MIWIIFLITLIALFGAAVFSFVNVAAWRIPRKMDFIKGSSQCPSCAHKLSPLDMLPIFGYLLLGGKCRYCKAKISLRYFALEILGSFFALLCLWKCSGDYVKALLDFAFISVLVFIALIDAATMEIPDTASVIIALLGVLSAVFIGGDTDAVGILDRLIGLICVSLPLLLITMALPSAFGGGDIKLMASTGLYLGWKLNCFAAFAAILLGGGYAIYLLITKKASRGEHFAFGPFLCAGLIISLFAGDYLIKCYLSLF